MLKLNLVRGLTEAQKILARIDPLDLSSLPESVIERTHRVFGEDVTPEQSVVRMLHDVRLKGDAAVSQYAKLLDGVDLEDFRIGDGELEAARSLVSIELREALQLAAEEEVRKQHVSRSYPETDELTEESYIRLYQKPRSELLKTFQKETRKDRRRNLSLSDLKEFTYWLHKRRINLWVPARVASDTRKAIKRLELLERSKKGRQSPESR